MITEEEKQELENIKNGNKLVDMLNQTYQPYSDATKQLKESLKSFSSKIGTMTIIGDSFIVYDETKSVKRALAKFGAGASNSLVTGLILIYTAPESGFTTVSIAFVTGDIVGQYTEPFLNALFDCIESKLPKQQGQYNNILDMINSIKSNMINGAINRMIYGF